MTSVYPSLHFFSLFNFVDNPILLLEASRIKFFTEADYDIITKMSFIISRSPQSTPTSSTVVSTGCRFVDGRLRGFVPPRYYSCFSWHIKSSRPPPQTWDRRSGDGVEGRTGRILLTKCHGSCFTRKSGTTTVVVDDDDDNFCDLIRPT